MAIRTIDYEVSVNGISPTSQQFGGTQGDHNVTVLKFTLSEPLRSAITSSAQGTVEYRFDGYDGSGGMRSTEPLELKDGVCEYALEEWVTRYGGTVQVYLVITDITDTTEMELYSFPAVLRLKDRPDGHPTDGNDYESVSMLYEGAKKSADRAEDAANKAEQVLEDIGGAIPDIDVTEVSDGVEITVTTRDEIETAKVYNGKDGAKGKDGKDGKDVDYSLVANALKGAKSGTVVSVKDMSPLEHPIKLKATFENGQPPVSTEMQIGDVATNYVLVDPVPIPEYDFINQDEMPEGVEFNHNQSSNSVVFGEQHQKGFFTHVYEFEGQSVGAMLTDGEKYYALYLVPHTGGDVAVAIDKNKAYVQIDGGEIKEYTVTEDESKNVTIYCATCYGMGFSGPTVNYATNIDIYDCSVNVNATAVKVKVLGKNLLNLNREKSILTSGQDATSKRTDFEFDKYYDGFIRTNIYYKGYAPATIENGVITVNSNNAYMGIAIPFEIKPNTTYIFSGNVIGDSPYCTISYYDDERNYLTVTNGFIATGFTAPSNAVIAVLCICSQTKGGIVTASNVQIEEGKTATEYEPYTEYGAYSVNADGTVDGIRSIYPSMTFVPDTEGVTLDVEYNRDINKAFAELQTALISMGGNI
jgi:hypothetical protein